MAKIKLNGDTSGYIEISAPAVSGNNTLELGPGTKILTNLDNTFTGVSTFTSGLHVTGGNVKIGTTTEGSAEADTLTIAESGSAGMTIRSGTAARGSIFFSDGTSGAAEYDGQIQYDQGERWMRFATAQTERLRIHSNGNVQVRTNNAQLFGAGTLLINSGSTSGRLDVYGGSSNRGGEINLYGGSNNDGQILFRSGAGAGQQPERLRITSTGQLLLGIDNAVASDVNFQIHSATSGVGPILNMTNNTGDCRIFFGQDNSSGGANAQGQIRYNVANNYLAAYAGGAEKLRIESDGQVVINRSSGAILGNTSSKLEVYNSTENLIFVSNSTAATGQDAGIMFGPANNVYGGKIIVTSDEDFSTSANRTAHMAFYTRKDGTAAERLRITSGGDLLLGGQTAYTYDDTGASNTILDIANSTNNKRGILSLSGNCNANGPSIGTIWFNNDQNSGTGPGATMKLAAAIQAKAVTSDSNAGDDSGAYLQFLTKPESAALAESMVIHSDGEVTKVKQPGFFARRSIVGDGRAPGAQEWTVSGTASFNTGSHFNASNGRFTAPIAGRYLFAAAPGYKQSGQNFQFYFRINGSDASEPVRFIDGGDDLTSHSLASGTVIYNLSANDYVEVYIGVTHHVNLTLNYFMGYLLG